MIATATGFWTATHLLILLNAVLALCAVASTVAALRATKSTEKLVEVSNEQVETLSKQVEIEQQQLDQEKSVQLASVMPLIVDVPLGIKVMLPPESGASQPMDLAAVYWAKDPDKVFRISVPFRNVGAGPAFIHKVFFTPSVGLVTWGDSKSSVVPVGELSNAYYSFTDGSSYYTLVDSWIAAGHMKVGIWYSDIGTNQRFQSTLEVELQKSLLSDFAVKRVLIYRCDEHWLREDEPFVQTGVAP
jgi:hypothetical protein